MEVDLERELLMAWMERNKRALSYVLSENVFESRLNSHQSYVIRRIRSYQKK